MCVYIDLNVCGVGGVAFTNNECTHANDNTAVLRTAASIPKNCIFHFILFRSLELKLSRIIFLF